ncbi:hypothetical protein ACHAO7_009401 [Fusarium culmorum]
MSNGKQSPSVQEKKHAECPFTITYAPGPSRADEGRSNNKKRKHNDEEFQIQISPFSPTGSFKAHDSLDVSYTVEPAKRWQDMTPYNSFVFNRIKYYRESFVYVANESTVNHQKPTNDDESGYKKSNGAWVARILEIRASDKHNVFARVYWMYWPEELPPGTICHNMRVRGRQSYHGTNELIASNHMDIINVVSVTAPAIVEQWIEPDDEEIQDPLYWRQAYDCRKPQLSVYCTYKPHQTYGAVSDEEEAKDVTCHLPPTGAEEKEAIYTIDVHSEKSRGNIHVKGIVPETPVVIRNSTPRPTSSKSIIATPKRPAKRPAKNDNKKKMGSFKPYAGLFEANLKMQDGPTVWEIRDLRESVPGDEKTWTEKACCLICGAIID